MEGFIHRENLALLRKHLAEPCDDARRQVLLRLLAEEEAKEPAVEEVRAPPLSAHHGSDGV